MGVVWLWELGFRVFFEVPLIWIILRNSLEFFFFIVLCGVLDGLFGGFF